MILRQALPIAGKLPREQGAYLGEGQADPQSRVLRVVVVEDPQDLLDDLLRIAGIDKLR